MGQRVRSDGTGDAHCGQSTRPRSSPTTHPPLPGPPCVPVVSRKNIRDLQALVKNFCDQTAACGASTVRPGLHAVRHTGHTRRPCTGRTAKELPLRFHAVADDPAAAVIAGRGGQPMPAARAWLVPANDAGCGGNYCKTCMQKLRAMQRNRAHARRHGACSTPDALRWRHASCFSALRSKLWR